MGQDEIAKLLEENHPRMLSYYEITEMLNEGRISVGSALRKLVKRDEIIYVIMPSDKSRGHWVRKYGIKTEENKHDSTKSK